MIHDLSEKIEQAYHNSPNSMGWRFLSSPAQTLHTARVAFIGLNPGGSSVDSSHGEFAMAAGQSAYRDESWAGYPAGESTLQRQVLSLFDRLGESPEAVLAGNFVPFRSPDWASLKDPASAIALGMQIWGMVFQNINPRVVVTMGAETTQHIGQLLNVSDSSSAKVGWGSITAKKGRFDGGWLIGLPHLSRFTIMTRPQSRSHLDALFSLED